jgi:hypothetical protein
MGSKKALIFTQRTPIARLAAHRVAWRMPWWFELQIIDASIRSLRSKPPPTRSRGYRGGKDPRYQAKEYVMETKILPVLLGLYAIHALMKFAFFFVLSYSRRRAALELAYKGKASATKISDLVLLVFVVGLVGLLIVRGADHVSFLTGLLVGMTLIQLYFHQFSTPLTPHEAPDPPASPIKIMSYAIQAKPSRPWKELIVIGCLLIWSLYGIARIGVR